MNEACNVTTALSAFSSISLEEMSTIRLMNRTDTPGLSSNPHDLLSPKRKFRFSDELIPARHCLLW